MEVEVELTQTKRMLMNSLGWGLQSSCQSPGTGGLRILRI